ncbi:MAG: N-acetylmuramoyl-L-alanine amidase [Pseudomonadota bacterium]
MMNQIYSTIRCFLIVVLTLLVSAQPSYALDVDDLRFGVHPDKTRMVIEMSEATEFKTFVLPDPYRVVVDLPEFSWKVSNLQKPKGDTIKDVRHGVQKPGISRLVIDVGTPVSLRSAFVLPAAAGKNNRLVIDFETVSTAVFNQRKDKTFGRLNSDVLSKPKPVTTATAPAPSNSASGQIVPTKKPPFKQVKPVIVIDPGHGGQDPGAIGANNKKEKDIVFAASKELKRQLEQTGLYTVKLTRSTDKYLKLSQRVAIARRNNADLFVSVHADSINKPNVQGASVYTLSDKASDKQTAMLAARENQADLIAGVDLSHEDQEVADILIDLAMRDTMNQSKFLANTLVDTMGARGMKLLPRPHRYAGFAVLKAPDVPSVLVEIGFMSNRKEAAKLSSPEYRRKVTSALVDGINVYFSKVRKNSRT